MSEECPQNSDYVNDYVASATTELENLKEAMQNANFHGKWVIIGERDAKVSKCYMNQREQYATSSLLDAVDCEQLVSPGVILYPDKNNEDNAKEDIKKAIKLCKTESMAIATRTGGHQYSGFSSTSSANMQIDLSEAFKEYEYDRTSKVLRCGVSWKLKDWAQENHKNGFYLPMGVCRDVYLGGHVSTGGWGMVARSHGLLADRVLAFEIILADGEAPRELRVVRPDPDLDMANSEENEKIYKAVLGGGKGGDFGIVTHYEFEPIPDVTSGTHCYVYLWQWTEARMRAVVGKMKELSNKDSTQLPSDYEFMLNIIGSKKPSGITSNSEAMLCNYLSQSVRDELALRIELALSDKDVKVLPNPTGPLIIMWMCFTNKNGSAFEASHFQEFKTEVGEGDGTLFLEKQIPISQGLAEEFIMDHPREMAYPFVKRFWATNQLKDNFVATYTTRVKEIINEDPGSENGQHLVSQMQVYTDGAVKENGQNEKGQYTSFSWREQVLAMSCDSFYEENKREAAEAWQQANDAAFIGTDKAFSDKDMRMFAYTFGKRPQKLENTLPNSTKKVWECYYNGDEKYNNLKDIKGEYDPHKIFSADEFSLTPKE